MLGQWHNRVRFYREEDRPAQAAEPMPAPMAS